MLVENFIECKGFHPNQVSGKEKRKQRSKGSRSTTLFSPFLFDALAKNVSRPS
jgi:hypothetical protein